MIHKYLSYLYDLPVLDYFLIAAVGVAFWAGIAVLAENKKWWKPFNGVAFGLSAAAILLVTVVARNYSVVGYSMVPFASFSLAKTYTDVYSEVALNSILFLPLGLTLPYTAAGRAKHPVLLAIMASCAFSVLIEVCQYIFRLGFAEIDDVIFNTLGAAIGACSYLLARLIPNKKAKGNG